MNLLWPSSLFLLVVLPLLIGLYLLIQRRRRKYALRYSSLSLVREAVTAQSRVRRYLPLALFLLALTSLVLAFTRPVTVAQVPYGQATVVLALDVSGSMRQRDILPSRLRAAQDAALSFIDRKLSSNQIGVVAFAGYAQLVQPPTSDINDLRSAIKGLNIGRGTAIGGGILEALDTIAEQNSDVAPSSSGSSLGSEVPPVTGGPPEYMPDIVVLLTDGVYTTGPPPLEAAQQAVDRGVRVYTIGFGTKEGQPNSNDFGGRRWNRGIDEETLQEIAAMTGGEYFSASSAGELQQVFESLPTYLKLKKETTEISVLFAAAGALLLASALILSQLWHPLP
jgi:Ca-activated chloride channel family protein